MRFFIFLMVSLYWLNVQGQENQIINLYDAFGDEAGEAIHNWGFSALINYNGKLILFDGGASSDILKHNSEIAGVDLSDVDIAVLSHSHYDHISGFDYLLEVNPKVKLYLPFDRTIGGRPVSNEQQAEFNKNNRIGYRFKDADVTYVKENLEIAPGIVLIATTSKLMGLFSRYPPHEEKLLTVGIPELSLALSNQEKKWTLVVGCSHSQVEEIVAETGNYLQTGISGLAGGFHLFPYDNEYIKDLSETIKKELMVEWVAPAHCTGEVGHEYLKTLFGKNYKYFGLGSKVKF